MDTLLINTTNLTKKYKKNTVVDAINLKVYKGQAFGLLGPNGSGKTTTLSMLLSIIKPTSGSIELFGSNDLDTGRKKIGATLETNGFFPDFSAEKNLKITALIKETDSAQIADLLAMVGLSDRSKDKVKSYSLGMKQRLSIASALLGNPELIILDEPTNGLDPRGILEVRLMIKQLSESGKTILVASHLLSEIEKVCSHVAILQKGKIIKVGSINEINAQYNNLEEGYMELTQ